MTESLKRGRYLGKIDVLTAFRLLHVHPSDHHLSFFFKFEHRFYNDMCLSRGCSISSALWGKFARFNLRIQAPFVKIIELF